MPPFPERESSILAKLKKKKGPGAVSVTELDDSKREAGELNGGADRGPDTAAMAASNAVSTLSLLFAKLSAFLMFPIEYNLPGFQSTPSPSADLLGIRSAAPVGAAQTNAGSLLVDVFSDSGPAAPSAAVNDDGFLR